MRIYEKAEMIRQFTAHQKRGAAEGFKPMTMDQFIKLATVLVKFDLVV